MSMWLSTANRMAGSLCAKTTAQVGRQVAAAVTEATFEADRGLSRLVGHAEWINRPLRERLSEARSAPIDTQLRTARRAKPYRPMGAASEMMPSPGLGEALQAFTLTLKGMS